jgi:hypothetical protein
VAPATLTIPAKSLLKWLNKHRESPEQCKPAYILESGPLCLRDYNILLRSFATLVHLGLVQKRSGEGWNKNFNCEIQIRQKRALMMPKKI